MSDQELFYLELGRRIRGARLDSKLTQEQLADVLGLTRTSITNIEKGKQKILAHTLVELAGKLKVSINDLIPAALQKPEGPRIDKLLHEGSSPAERNFLEAALKKAKKK